MAKNYHIHILYFVFISIYIKHDDELKTKYLFWGHLMINAF